MLSSPYQRSMLRYRMSCAFNMHVHEYATTHVHVQVFDATL